MKAPPNGYLPSGGEGERKTINLELWHACAGPLVSLPPAGSLVVYFPQGHSEQVAASMQKEADVIPSYPNLPSKLVCILHNVTLHADLETDEVYAQMTLQPVSKFDKEAILASEIGLKQSGQPSEFFCKTLTASDTSTHGGFSVPRRAAEKIFPALDFSMQPPAQELTARDLHNNSWTFRHIYRGQPKRHLLTTGWSVFVSTKRLFAGDSVLFIRDEKSQLMLGVRRANRQQPALSSSVISSDSMHIGVLAAAAHAAANNSPFVIFFNPRASPAEFVIPFSKYNKAMYTQVSLGMRYRMMFETEESGIRRYMGTVTGISDLDSVRWKNSQWRNLQVGWDESTAGERPSRVSIWDIEPVVTPFYLCPPPFFRPKFPRQPGMPDDESDMGNVFKRAMPWLGDEFGMKDPTVFPGLSLNQWMSMQQNNQFPSAQLGFFPSMVPPVGLHNNPSTDDPTKLLNFQAPGMSPQAIQFNKANPQNQIGQLTQSPLAWNQQQKQLQQLSQNPISQQQQQQPPLLQQLPNQKQQRVPQPSPQQQQPNQQQQPLAEAQQTRQSTSHLQQKTQMFQALPLNDGLVAPNQIQNQTLQHQAVFSQLQQQQQIVNSNTQVQSTSSANKTPNQINSLPQDPPFQHQMEPKSNILQRQQQQQQQPPPSGLQLLQQNLSQCSQPQAPAVSQMQQLPQAGLSDQQLQFLQKQQQQHQYQLLPGSLLLQPQLSTQPYTVQNQQFQHSTLLQNQQQPLASQIHALQKSPTAVRVHSNLTDGDAPSCSTSPSTNNCQISPQNFLNRSQQQTIFMGESVIEPTRNAIHDIHGKSDVRIKHEFASSKEVEQRKYKGSLTDPLEASSSGTSYCLDAGTIQQNFSLPTFGLDGDVQSQSRSSPPFASIVDGMAPDALLSRGYDSQKDLQNLLANYSCAQRDIETELSTAAISSQSFGVPNLPFKPPCSNDVHVNEQGVLGCGGVGLWGNQTQRMRTYTKVQKRGSVGRSIDVTRYKCYDELRHDLACMFGIEGQLEDPQSSDWKLVYVDHENDILLVGDDPWEEFVSCVQSIKILSSGEVQQLSLDGDLGNVPVSNHACSGTHSGNAWRTHYDDHSAASFNR